MQSTLTFPGIREGEVVREIVHKHWITYFFILLRVGFYLVMVGIFFYSLTHFLAFKFTSPSVMLIFFGILLSIWFWFFVQFLDEELDCLILTNERLIDVTQTGLFSITFSETNLDLIQNVRGSIKGFFGNILHYGMIDIQTASRSESLAMDYVSDPEDCSQKILGEKEKFLERYGRRKEEIVAPSDQRV